MFIFQSIILWQVTIKNVRNIDQYIQNHNLFLGKTKQNTASYPHVHSCLLSTTRLKHVNY